MTAADGRPLWVVGDIHGQFAKMKRLLQDAELIDETLTWSGGDARVWFMGDFFDRGTDGISSLALAMRMQEEAARAGGEVNALLGNHEVGILSALKFPDNHLLVQAWGRNGGMPDEPAKLTPDMVDWIIERPAMALVDDLLLMHADAGFYALFGTSIEQVNEAIASSIRAKTPQGFEYLVDLFAEHQTFFTVHGNGIGRAHFMLDLFGGKRIVHGHTPIHHMSGEPPASITGPFVYAHDLCMNVDGSIYSGGPGFAYRVS